MAFIKRVTGPHTELEVELQEIAAKYEFAPKILNVTEEDDALLIEMEKIEGDLLADKYGDEDPGNVPEWIWEEIRRMLTVLYEEEGIEYVDVTPYNFIETDDGIYMIDFGDACYIREDQEQNWYLEQFLNSNDKTWNPDYK